MSKSFQTSEPTMNLHYLNVRADDARYYVQRAIAYEYDYAGADPYNAHDHIHVNAGSNIQKIIKSIIELLQYD